MSKISSKIVFSDLTGGLNNVDSKENINASPRKTETPDMVNIEYFKLGGIKTMEGNTFIGNKLNDKVIGGWEYIKDGNRYMIVGLANGEVYIYNPITERFDFDALDSENSIDYIYKFESPSERMSFCNMNNGVVITNGIDDPIFYEAGRHVSLTGTVSTTANSTAVTGSGTTFTVQLSPGDRVDIDGDIYTVDSITDDTSLTLTDDATATKSDVQIYLGNLSQCNAQLINTDPELVPTPEPRPIRGLAIQFYNGRLWIGGANGLFYSQVGQYNKWDEYYDAGYIGDVYNDTSEVTALGLFSEYLMVHKEINTYVLTCSGDSSTIAIKPFSNITCNSQQSWIVSNTKYFVYSRDFMDIYPLVQHTVFSDKFLGEPVTSKVRNIFENIRSEDVKDIFCVSRPKHRQMMFYLPMINQAGSGYALIYDFQTKSFLLRVVPQEVTAAFNYNNNIYIGTQDGLVLREFSGRAFQQWDYTNNEIMDTPIEAYYRSPWFDWSNGYTQSFAEFMIEIANELNNDFIIRTQKDGQSRYEDRNIKSETLIGKGLIWDGYNRKYPYNINFYVTVGYDENEDPIYELIDNIPDTDEAAVADRNYYLGENIIFKFYRENNDLEVYTYNTSTEEQTLYLTLSDYYANINEISEYDNNTVWDDDSWVRGTFETIRMLLPNNVFEDFQVEFRTDNLYQSFAIYQYSFRRIETEEAPW